MTTGQIICFSLFLVFIIVSIIVSVSNSVSSYRPRDIYTFLASSGDLFLCLLFVGLVLTAVVSFISGLFGVW